MVHCQLSKSWFSNIPKRVCRTALIGKYDDKQDVQLQPLLAVLQKHWSFCMMFLECQFQTTFFFMLVLNWYVSFSFMFTERASSVIYIFYINSNWWNTNARYSTQFGPTKCCPFLIWLSRQNANFIHIL